MILPEVSVQRWPYESKSCIPVVQAYVIQTYNKHMGEVGHHNWLLGKHSISIRGKNGTGLYSQESWTGQWSIVLYYTDLFMDRIQFQ